MPLQYFRTTVDIFGLAEDLPTECHVVLYDFKKFKTVNKTYQVSTSNYLFHPPYNEIHMQNYPHTLLVRRRWSRQNDIHIVSEPHSLIWHGQMVASKDPRIMFLRELFKRDKLGSFQHFDKGFNVGGTMLKEIDMFIFTCHRVDEINGLGPQPEDKKSSSFFDNHKSVRKIFTKLYIFVPMLVIIPN